MKESEEKKKQVEELLKKERETLAMLEKQKLDEAKKWDEEQRRKYQQNPGTTATPAFTGAEKSFLSLQVEEYLARKTKEIPQWVQDELATAKTKKFTQRLLDQINLVRTQPRVYAENLLKLVPFFSENTMGGASFICEKLHAEDRLKDGLSGIKELNSFLENMAPCKSLTLEKGLSLSCMELCEIQGPKGLEGLEGETDEERRKRFFSYAKAKDGRMTQVANYGAFMPVHVTLQLLLDDDRPGRPRRTDILNPEWGVVGIHGGKHAKKLFMCSLIFAEGLL